jgi:hypothetical protein
MDNGFLGFWNSFFEKYKTTVPTVPTVPTPRTARGEKMATVPQLFQNPKKWNS